jgi:hypothetical protein
VYLERPWWSSGDGELLGVVTFRLQSAKSIPADRLLPYITQWGLDPLFTATSLPVPFPDSTRFPLSSGHRGMNLALDEISESVDVAGHVVEFDSTRDLYYCDIEVNCGKAYMPFIRLALARYQPSSVAEAHLSRIILADYIQLAPDRAAAVIFSKGRGSRDFTVTLSGPSYSSSATQLGPGIARATLEERDFALNQDLGWIPRLGPTSMRPSSGPGIGVQRATSLENEMSKVYFFRSDKYCRYDVRSDNFEYRADIAPDNWSGLPCFRN